MNLKNIFWKSHCLQFRDRFFSLNFPVGVTQSHTFSREAKKLSYEQRRNTKSEKERYYNQENCIAV